MLILKSRKIIPFMMTTNNRKTEHIQIIEKDKTVDRDKHYFDQIVLKHRALPEINPEEVDTSTEFMGKKLSFPLLISSMTGGDDKQLININKNLAIAAEKTNVAMAVGSQRVMFENEKALKGFELRQYASKTLLFANLGAIQLNNSFTIEECQKAVDVLQADALYLHLNPLQEMIQPEGNTNFKGLAEKIGEITRKLKVPVIIKEVGSGISVDDAGLLIKEGVKYIDVAGAGGTSWSRIEDHRNEKTDLGETFQDWGIPTPIALEQLHKKHPDIDLIASGGIRSGIHMAKAIILGASLCGMAKPFLKPAMESADAVIHEIERIKKEFATAMFLLGITSVKKLYGNKALVVDYGFSN